MPERLARTNLEDCKPAGLYRTSTASVHGSWIMDHGSWIMVEGAMESNRHSLPLKFDSLPHRTNDKIETTVRIRASVPFLTPRALH